MTEATATAGASERLRDEGVSIWPDDLSRERISSGDLAGPVGTGSVVDVTAGPSVFRAAIGSTVWGSRSAGGAERGGGHPAWFADLAAVERLGLPHDEVVRQLEEEGVRKSEAAWPELLDAAAKARDDEGVDAE
ncbi:hypothetical protein [Streptomyces sp. MUM 2J]|uniref:hypothetical protein n=1 Tax=unclassified Streptomyces TaxID=2593676 RepID=UPI0035AB783C